MHYKKKSYGFTLVELSVVIIIIGLIVAGIVGGANLVKSSKIRTLIGEVTSTRVAYNTFKLSFDQVPGDFDKAYDYWGATCDADPIKCNGNGNGVTSWSSSGDSGSTNNTDDNETFRSWQHLYLAGLIKQAFTGKSVSGDTSNSTKEEMFFSLTGLTKFYFVGRNNHTFGMYRKKNGIVMGSAKISDNIWAKTFTTGDALSIDKKIDDCIANKGKILAGTNTAPPDQSCSEAFSHATGSDYNVSNLTSTSLECVILAVF